jgi:PAS domain S-box-containing protein
MLLQNKNAPLASQLLAQVFQNYSLAFWSGLLISAVPVLALWTAGNHVVLLGWILVLWIELSVRYVYARRYSSAERGADESKWRAGVVTIAAIDGAFWGLSVWIFAASPTDPATMFLLLVIACVAVFDSRELAAVPLAATSCLLTTLLPVSLWMFSFGAPLTTLMGIAILGYMGLLQIFSRHTYHSICRLLSSTEKSLMLAAAQMENEQRMARYFESAPGYFFTIEYRPDNGNAITFASPGIRELFGLEPDAVMQDFSAFIAITHPDDIGMVFSKAEDSSRNLTPYHIEYRIIHPQKGVRWFEVHALPQSLAEGGRRWDGFMHDITERKQSEQQLKEALAFNEGIISAIPDILFELDREGRYLNCWTQAPVVLEAQTALLGKTVREVLSPESAEEAMAAIREADEKGSAFSKAIAIVQADGEVRWYEHSLSKKQGNSPSEATILALSRDVTGRKRMEAEVKQREAAFRALAENLPDQVFRYDRDCRRVYVNPVAERISAMQANQLLGNTPGNSSTLMPESAVRAMAAIREVFATRERREIYVEYDMGDGKTREYKALAVPEFGPGGQVETALAILHEVTDLREAERRAASFFANMPGFAFTFHPSPEGRMSFPFASRGIEEIYGLHPDDVRDDAAALHAMAHPDDQPRIEAAITESAQMLQPFHVELRVQRPGQPERWVECRSMPERQVDGELLWYGVMLDITERKRMEEDIRRAAEFQNSLLLGIRDSGTLLVVIENGRVIHFGNRDIAHQLGFSDEAIAAHPNFIDVVHPDDRDWIADLYRRRINGEPVPSIYELGLMLPDGSRREFEVAVAAVPDTDPVRSIHILRDITERKRMEESLRARENEYRTLAENFPDVVIRYDRDYKRIYVNPAFLELAGARANELLGKLPQDTSPLLDMDAYMAEMRNAMERGIASSRVLPVRRANGEEGWYMGSFVPEFDAGGNVSGVLMVARDISERIRMEQALQESEAKYRHQHNLLLSILDSTFSVGIYALDLDYRLLAFNRAFRDGAQRMWGADVAVGMSMFDALDTDALREFCRKGYEHVLAGNSIVVETKQEVVRDGITVVEYHDNYASPIRDENGTVIGLTVFTANTTERKHLQAALQESEAQYRHQHNLLNSILESPNKVAVYALDREYRFLAFNNLMRNGAKRLWGADIEVGMNMLDEAILNDDAHRAFCKQGFDYVLAGNNFYIESKQAQSKDGETFYEYHDNYSSPIYDDKGDVIGLTVFATNTSERKHIEQALVESEARYRHSANLLQSMFDGQSSVGIYALDREYRYLAFNNRIRDRAETLLGSEIAVGMSMLEAIKNDEYREFCRQGFDYVLAGNNFFIESKEAVVKDGETTYEYHENYASPIYDDRGEVIGLTVFVANITGRKQTEHKLEEYRTQLRGLLAQREQAREEERKLIARDVHDDLGQILTGLKMNLSVMERKCGEDAPALHELILQSRALMDSAISTVRNISSALRPVELDMGIATAISWHAGRFATYTGIACEVHIDDDESHLDENDAVALFRIVQESLTNIAKHARASKVNISLGGEADDYVLKVCDNGTGFDVNLKKDSSFGLIGMKERVLLLGGTLSINSNAGEGTEITVRFPAAVKNFREKL